MALPCDPGTEIPVDDLVNAINTNETNISSHTGDTNNPHGVTAAQAGADPAGSADAVQTNLDSHTAATDNPHSVTTSQIGAVNNNDGAHNSINTITALTQAEYDGITPDPNTLYVIIL